MKNRMAGKSKAQAAREAGYAETMARHATEKIERKPAIQSLLSRLMEKAGLTDEFLVKRMKEGLSANVVHFPTQYSKREVCVDFRERREMLALAIEMKGLKPAEKHDHRVTLEDILSESYGNAS